MAGRLKICNIYTGNPASWALSHGVVGVNGQYGGVWGRRWQSVQGSLEALSPCNVPP